MNIQLVTPAADEPVSLAEFKQHLRLDGDAEDADLAAKLLAARVHIENITNRALVSSTWRVYFRQWPGCRHEDDVIRVPLGVQSVSGVTYVDSAGTHTVDPSTYEVDALSGEILLASGAAWPTATLKKANPICVEFIAGWADAGSVPSTLKVAIELLAAHWYRNREAVTVGSRAASGGAEATPMISTPLAMAVDALCGPYVLWRF